jgi:hypothetical protein
VVERNGSCRDTTDRAQRSALVDVSIRCWAFGVERWTFASCRLEFGVSTVQEIGEAIQHLDVRGQMQLLRDLPAHLKIQPDDIAWLKAAEPAFEFWNNSEDAVYDEL